MELYKTVRNVAEAEQTIERSRFIAHVSPASTREEADAFIEEIKGKYRDATHNVPAMVIGERFQVQWASDDGEPQGTSGAPMVQMLVKEGLTNLVIVVTRYFGGIKLGTGGLVRAYTGTAKLGIEVAEICSACEMSRLRVRIEYPILPRLQNMAGDRPCESEAGFSISDIAYSDRVELDMLMPPEKEEVVEKLLLNITAGKAEVLSRHKELSLQAI